jgi:hypothetical protein
VRGKFRVVQTVKDVRFPEQMTHVFFGKDDFVNTIVNPKVGVPDYFRGKIVGTKYVARGWHWLGQAQRADYDDIDFRPGKPSIIKIDDRRIINMYSGFACTPNF